MTSSAVQAAAMSPIRTLSFRPSRSAVTTPRELLLPTTQKKVKLGSPWPMHSGKHTDLAREQNFRTPTAAKTESAADFRWSARSCRTHDPSLNVRHRGIREVRVIPDVEEVRREPHVLALADLEVLQERNVPVLLEWPVVNVSSQVSESRCAIVRIRDALRRIDLRLPEQTPPGSDIHWPRADECCRSSIHSDGRSRSQARAQQWRAALAEERRARAPESKNRERHSGLEDCDAAQTAHPPNAVCAMPASA